MGCVILPQTAPPPIYARAGVVVMMSYSCACIASCFMLASSFILLATGLANMHYIYTTQLCSIGTHFSGSFMVAVGDVCDLGGGSVRGVA